MMFLGPLTRLASDSTPPADREAAARELDAILRRWGLAYLERSFGTKHASLYEDALQHCALQAWCGRFAGTTEGEAVNWCKQVVRNFVLSTLRRRRREAPLPTAPDGSEAEPSDPAPTDAETRSLERDVRRLLQHVVTAAANANGGVADDAVFIWLEYRMTDASIDEQVDKWAFRGANVDEVRDDAGLTRARNRIYQWRTRGRKAACAAAKALVRTGTVTDEAGFLVRILACKPNEGPEC